MVVRLRYLKDSNAADHSVDSDIFYTVIYLPARSKTYINLYFLKQCQIVGNLSLYASSFISIHDSTER